MALVNYFKDFLPSYLGYALSMSFKHGNIEMVVALSRNSCWRHFTLYKWRSDVADKRSLKFRELTMEIRKDEKVSEIIYMLDDDTFQWFSEDAVDNLQKAAFDKLLFHFCYVIYLYRHHFVKKDEFNTLSYEIERALLNPQMQDYL